MSEPTRIAARIARALGDETLVDKLVTLPQSELTSLLLEVFRRRSGRRSAAELMRQYERGGALLPSRTEARLTAAVEAQAFLAAAGFEAQALAPVAPLGLNVVLGDVDQNSTLAAARGLEVLADSTTVMALECARRRQAGAARVRLCAAARMLRLQPFDNPAFSPHFALFALASADSDRGAYAVELGELDAHVRVHLDLLRRLSMIGYRFFDLRVEIADTARDASGERRLAAVETTLFPGWRADFPEATCAIDRARTHAMAYYRGLCLHIGARDGNGNRQLISDGGCTDWTQRLRSNAKERLLVSGLGTELLVGRFRPPG